MPDKRDLEPLLNVEQNQLGLVMADSDGIDTKALAILGANIAVLIFIDQASLHLVVWQFILLYAPFVLSLLIDIRAIWPHNYLGAGADITTSPHYLKMDHEKLILQLLTDTISAIQHNTKLNKRRLLQCTTSMVLTVLGFLGLLFIL